MKLKTGSFAVAAALCLAAFVYPVSTTAQNGDASWTRPELAIREQISHLRELADDVRARTTKQLALDIRALSKTEHKLVLANALGNLSTEGDFGHETLQEVATTLASALKEQPVPMNGTEPDSAYVELATLVRYEHVQASSDDQQFKAAIAKLEADDAARANADFTLTDLRGKTWALHDLRGKVVMVNFWATWCQPCQKEMPDLDALYQRFKNQGLVVLAISDEETNKVTPFLTERPVTYPILLDPGRKVNELFHIDSIPKTFVYDRDGKLVAQSVDMRTRKQFIEMLAHAGLPRVTN